MCSLYQLPLRTQKASPVGDSPRIRGGDSERHPSTPPPPAAGFQTAGWLPWAFLGRLRSVAAWGQGACPRQGALWLLGEEADDPSREGQRCPRFGEHVQHPSVLKAIPPDSVATGAVEKGAVGDEKKTPVLRP